MGGNYLQSWDLEAAEAGSGKGKLASAAFGVLQHCKLTDGLARVESLGNFHWPGSRCYFHGCRYSTEFMLIMATYLGTYCAFTDLSIWMLLLTVVRSGYVYAKEKESCLLSLIVTYSSRRKPSVFVLAGDQLA